MRVLICALAALGVITARSEVLFHDSFEVPGRLGWESTWGEAKRCSDIAQDGEWSIEETLEDRHGLSVWYIDFETHPGATYRASAWVFIPAQERAAAAALSLNRTNWNNLAVAATGETDRWVQLTVEYTNRSERAMRLQLFQSGQKPGLGGVVMYWDNVTVERELGQVKADEGMRLNPLVAKGLDVAPCGGLKVTVAPGVVDVDGGAVDVSVETVIELRPVRRIRVSDETLRLTDDVPAGYGKGTALRGCVSVGSTGLAGTLVSESLVLKRAPGPDGEPFVEGRDWRADKTWGRVGRIPGGTIGPEDVVYADYAYSLMRLDTIEVRSDGAVLLREGAEHKMCPVPPEPDMHARALCNVFLPYHCAEVEADHIYPIGPGFPAATQAEIGRKAALIPGSLRKLREGGEFTLLFWGDSVTCGGDASAPERAFPRSFTTWLRDKFPQSHIRYVNAGTGGWNSNSKLPLFQEEVLDREPDLVIIEFVNDMGLDRERLFANYDQAVSRIREIGGEVIILTPHFTRPDWMRASGMRTDETRAAVRYLKDFAAENKVGLADASRRWAHLWLEGLPYITLLYNGINHPDDRGHQLFVQELRTFFP